MHKFNFVKLFRRFSSESMNSIMEWGIELGGGDDETDFRHIFPRLIELKDEILLHYNDEISLSNILGVLEYIRVEKGIKKNVLHFCVLQNAVIYVSPNIRIHFVEICVIKWKVLIIYWW